MRKLKIRAIALKAAVKVACAQELPPGFGEVIEWADAYEDYIMRSSSLHFSSIPLKEGCLAARSALDKRLEAHHQKQGQPEVRLNALRQDAD